MATAILIDGAFFLHRYRALVADAATHTADDVADTLVRWSLAHLNQQDERRDLYRIFFYDCPPLTKKVHTPVGNVLRDFAESPEARFRTTLHEALSRKRKLVLRRGQLADFNQWNIKPMVQRQILKGERSVDDLRDDDFIYDVRQNGIDTLMALDVAGIVYKKLADQVVSDWDNLPLEKTNNHSYWAAWSVMASAVILDRRDLFDWAVAQYRQGVGQVDEQGYLPRELSRQTRALAYHNYSMAPLLMIAAFAQANGLDLRAENADGLQRLARRLESGLQDPKIFQERTGYPQTLEDLQDSNRFAWLEPYCALYSCSAKTDEWRRSIEPLDTYRLGGDMTQLFSRNLP